MGYVDKSIMALYKYVLLQMTVAGKWKCQSTSGGISDTEFNQNLWNDYCDKMEVRLYTYAN
jgi:hypothetical protein